MNIEALKGKIMYIIIEKYYFLRINFSYLSEFLFNISSIGPSSLLKLFLSKEMRERSV